MKLTPLFAILIITAFSGAAQSNPKIENERLLPGKILQHPAKHKPSLQFNNRRFNRHPRRAFRHHYSGFPSIIATHGWHSRSRPLHHWRTKHATTVNYRQQKVYYIIDNTGYHIVDAPKVRVNQARKVTPEHRYQLGQLYSSLPTGAEPITIAQQQYFKYHDIYFLAQISGDSIKYLALKLH